MGLRERISETLNDVDYPVDKQELVHHAETHATEEVVKALRALPLADYRNDAEVLSAVPLPADEERTDDEKARQAPPTRHRKSHLAEHMRDVEPTSPPSTPPAG